MLREHDQKLRVLLLVADIALCAAVLLVVGKFEGAELPVLSGALEPWKLVVFAASAASALPLALRAMQRDSSMRMARLVTYAWRLLVAGGVSVVLLAAVAFALDVPIGPVVLFGGLLAQLGAVGLLRLSILVGLRILRRHGRNFRNILVIGTGPRASELTRTMQKHPEWGLRIVGYVDTGDIPLDDRIPKDRVFKLVDFPNLLRQVVDEVIVACPRSMLADLGPALEACSAAGVPITLMTDLFGDYLPPPRVRRFGAVEALSFRPVHHNRVMLITKRALDIAGALLGLIVAAPALAIAAAAIRLDSKGPVLFRQIRCGLHGRPFVMYKLRTMVCDAESQQEHLRSLNEMQGPVFKIRRDPRITGVGRFLRAFSIDELPQFWSVLIGDMSLVGPRPPLPGEVARYETSERRRLSMRPGLTCLWQVNGRNELDFDEWVKLDLQYIDAWSLRHDLKILLLTIPTVLRGTGS
jgi:exopolysaccharide biosynthesis polyprenyl glycosylphosphotransferase